MKRLIRSAIGLVIIVCVAVLVIRTSSLMADPLFEDVSDPQSVDVQKSEQKFNALLVGVDNSGLLADAIMIVNVNKENSTINLLSIPRDTKIYYKGRYCKINSCYGDGIDVLIDEVKKLTGVYLNYYAVITPDTLSTVVDALGGVEYTVEKDMYYSDPEQNLNIELKKGKQTLNGTQAEQYCRYRQYVMGDYQRMQAQHRFFKALLEQKLNVKYIPKIYGLYTELEQKIKTNVSLADIVSNIDVMKLLSSGSVNCYDTPGEYNDMQKEGVSYYIIKDKNLNELRQICTTFFKI